MPETVTRAGFPARLAASLAAAPPDARVVVALAGAPASGKSTLAEAAVAALLAQGHPAALLPMDGFHYDDEVLGPRGWRAAKGQPHTFDAGGLASALARLRARDEPHVAVPRFDREIEIARAGAILIPQAVRLVLCEGNWLLLDEEPWRQLHPLFDLTVMLEVPEAERAARLEARWRHHGLPEAELRAKIEENDLPNGRRVEDGSIAAHVVIRE